ncbi:MAG: class I SAM-dependent methyltransferase [Thermoplasmata archaeon]
MVPSPNPSLVEAWESEYRAGRYLGDPPLPFVDDIWSAATTYGLGSATGLYVGCGNGRNFLPLVARGLDLVGLDVSATALAQLAERAPQLTSRLVCGDVSALAPDAQYRIVIAIQVLQHGNERTTHQEVRRVLERVTPGGLFCLRVNAVGTEPEHDHTVVDQGADGRFTLRYRAGPKRNLEIHFFTSEELRELIEDRFIPVLPLRSVVTQRPAPGRGHWDQWEGIWRRPTIGR